MSFFFFFMVGCMIVLGIKLLLKTENKSEDKDKTCPNCKGRVGENQMFCHDCGNKLRH